MAYGDSSNRPLAHAWILLCLGLALHVYDAATTGFLKIYNPTVTALRERLGWWPMPTFQFGPWLSGSTGAAAARRPRSSRNARSRVFLCDTYAGECRRAYAVHNLRPDRFERDLSSTCPGILVLAIYGGGCNLLAGAASQFGSAQGR